VPFEGVNLTSLTIGLMPNFVIPVCSACPSLTYFDLRVLQDRHQDMSLNIISLFPNLRVFKFSCRRLRNENLANFLLQAPLLVKLDLFTKRFSYDMCIIRYFFYVIEVLFTEGEVLHTKPMKVFSIKICKFCDSHLIAFQHQSIWPVACCQFYPSLGCVLLLESSTYDVLFSHAQDTEIDEQALEGQHGQFRAFDRRRLVLLGALLAARAAGLASPAEALSALLAAGEHGRRWRAMYGTYPRIFVVRPPIFASSLVQRSIFFQHS